MNQAILPPTTTVRWTISRKALVVNAVKQGLIKEAEAKRRYNLSSEEFGNWKTLVDAFGVPGLRATRIQKYRQELKAIA